jgi:hypothetical protein
VSGNDIQIISMNTDGIMVKVPPEREEEAFAIIADWEKTTGFEMERKKLIEYRRLNVNTYIAIGEAGDIKSKGLLNFQPGLDGDPNFLIVAESVAMFMKDGTDPAETIKAAAEGKNLFKFAKVVTTNGPGFHQGGEEFGNVVRVYRAKGEVAPIITAAHGKVGERTVAAGCRIFRSLSDWPTDIDVDAYVAEAKAIIDETDVVIDNTMTKVARDVEALGLDTVGLGGSTGVRRGGNFSGTEVIGVKVSPSRNLIYAPAEVRASIGLGEDSIVLRTTDERGGAGEIHLTVEMDKKALRALKKAEGVIATGTICIHGGGYAFTPGVARAETVIDEDETVGDEVIPVETPVPVVAASASRECRDNWDFLEAVYGEAAGEAYVIAFTGNPKTTKKWGGGPAKFARNSFLNTGMNTFVSISTFTPAADGAYHRRIDDFAALYCLLFDDVGTKAKDPRDHGFGPPTSMVETSPGNYQMVYALSEPLKDRAMAEQLVKAVTRSNLGLTDKSAGEITRVFRLPHGTNWKPEYGPDGFKHRLVEWNPDVKYTPEQILRWVGEDPGAIKAKAEAMPPRSKALASDRAFDHPIIAAFEAEGRLLDKRVSADGWIAVECPWSDDHSGGRKKDGAAIRVNEDGTWGFNCMHDHCSGTKRIVRNGEEVEVKERGASAVMERLQAFGHAVSRPRDAIWRSAFDDAAVLARAEEVMARVGEGAAAKSSGDDEGVDGDGVDMSVFAEDGDALQPRGPQADINWSARELFDPWFEYIAPEFPLDTLPDGVRAFAENTALQTGACVSGAAMSCLAVASAAIDHNVALALNDHRQFRVSPRLWALLAGRPSQKKTPLQAAAKDPLIKLGLEERRRVEILWNAMSDEERKSYEKRNGGKMEGVRYVVNDVTPEATAKILERQRPGLLIGVDELSQFVGQMDRYDSGAAARGFWLTAYDGKPYSVERVGRRTTPVDCLSVSFLGGIQPRKLRKMGDLDSDGLLQRFIPVMLRDATMGSRKFDPRPIGVWADTCARLTRLRPHELALSPGAVEIRWEIDRKLHMYAKAARNESEAWESFLGKLLGVWGNITLVLHHLHGHSPEGLVSEDIARKAQKVIEDFVMPHGLVFYQEVFSSTPKDLRSLAAFIARHERPTIKRRDIARGVKSCQSLSSEEITARMESFILGGWVEATRNWPPADEWVIRPGLADTFSAGIAAQREIANEVVRKLTKRSGRSTEDEADDE